MDQFKDEEAFVDQEEWMTDESRLKLHVHFLIKKNGWLTNTFKGVRSFAVPEEWMIDDGSV